MSTLTTLRGLFGEQPSWSLRKEIQDLVWSQRDTTSYPVLATYAREHLEEWGRSLWPQEPLEDPPDFLEMRRLRMHPDERVYVSMAPTKGGLVFLSGTFFYIPNIGFVADNDPEISNIISTAVYNGSLEERCLRRLTRIITVVVVWDARHPEVHYWNLSPGKLKQFYDAWTREGLEPGSTDFYLRCTDVRFQTVDTTVLENQDRLTSYLDRDVRAQHLLKTVAFYTDNAQTFLGGSPKPQELLERMEQAGHSSVRQMSLGI